MRPSMLDPTAGESARAIREHPGALPRIVDPTDPRCGQRLPDSRGYPSNAQRILDPTDPRYGEGPA